VEEDVIDADFYNPENEVAEPVSDKEEDDKDKKVIYTSPYTNNQRNAKTSMSIPLPKRNPKLRKPKPNQFQVTHAHPYCC
jgi:hypothetical protein